MNGCLGPNAVMVATEDRAIGCPTGPLAECVGLHRRMTRSLATLWHVSPARCPRLWQYCARRASSVARRAFPAAWSSRSLTQWRQISTRPARSRPTPAPWRSTATSSRMPDVDAVIVALPPALHASAAIAALDKGKHVYVEKPLATSVDDAGRVLEAGAAVRPHRDDGIQLSPQPARPAGAIGDRRRRSGDPRERAHRVHYPRRAQFPRGSSSEKAAEARCSIWPCITSTSFASCSGRRSRT
jgi:hypothetical protein